ncbi:MAG: GIY-YIG nuclease family protein [Scytolyngbya sp. HA4215-MV1]|nr:GIY-YIG nuclease family protein [Scytolyngbya sp. HA4215-MV1]
MPSSDRIKREADRILRIIQKTKFDAALPLERGYSNLSFAAGIYAIKSGDEILYIGKANAFRTRFQSGHQTLIAIMLDGLSPSAIRIVTVPTSARYADFLLDLEKRILFALQPKYNKYIPSLDAILAMQLREPTSGHIKNVLNYLPDPVVDALEDHADTYGLTDAQVIELAIANLLDLETTSLNELKNLETLAQLKERVAMLEAVIRKNGLTVPELPEEK